MDVETTDVIVVGAGLTGVGAAVHLQRECPDKQVLLLEARESMGGTWDLFRYPGVRSDSDMHTLGYDFKPWTDAKAIADGASIRDYIKETARDYGIDKHIRYRHRVREADWDATAALWHLQVDTPEGPRQMQCRFLLMCAGYFRYDRGHAPEFPGQADFRGPVIHPQHWPQDLDYRNRRILVIGSGATAVTLVPSLAKQAANVTLLQRSPTWMLSRPARDRLANALRRVLPDRWAYALTRRKNTFIQNWFWRRSRRQPREAADFLLKRTRQELAGSPVDIDPHFIPRYQPWDQRLCLVPDGDLFSALREGRAEMLTAEIDRFTERGVRLRDGRELPADIIVTATGLEVQVLGGIRARVDGREVDVADSYTWHGMMFTGLPNLINTFGYINASWTLRSDLIARFACRLLRHMDSLGARQVTPVLRPGEENMPARPWIEGFSAGYLQRVMHRLPKQGDREPWLNSQDYRQDRRRWAMLPLDDGSLEFRGPPDSGGNQARQHQQRKAHGDAQRRQ